MKKSLITLLLLLIPIINCFAQATFYKNFFSASQYSYGLYVDQTSDGGYILTGQTSIPSGPSNTVEAVFVIKTDRGGNQTFVRTYNFGGFNNPSLVTEVQGGYLLIAGGKGIFIDKIDTFGNILWTKSYATTYDFDNGIYSIKTLDGGYLIQATLKNGSGHYIESLILKTNSNGDTLWTRNFQLVNSFGTCSQTQDSGFVFVGPTEIYAPNSQISLLKIDSHGNFIWNKNYVGSHCDAFGLAVCANSKGILLAGTLYDSCTSNIGNLYLSRINIDGDTLWSKMIYSPKLLVRGINSCSNEDYILTGGTDLNGVDSATLFFSRIDVNGNILWTHTFNSINGSIATFAKQTSDGGFIITGEDSVNITNGTYGRVALIKTDGMGNALFVKSIDKNPKLLQIYPNPTSDFCTIRFNSFSPDNYHLKLWNSLGEWIMSKQISITSLNQSEILYLRNYPSGIYYLQVQSGKEMKCIKIVKE